MAFVLSVVGRLLNAVCCILYEHTCGNCIRTSDPWERKRNVASFLNVSVSAHSCQNQASSNLRCSRLGSRVSRISGVNNVKFRREVEQTRESEDGLVCLVVL